MSERHHLPAIKRTDEAPRLCNLRGCDALPGNAAAGDGANEPRGAGNAPPGSDAPRADFTLRIAPVALEIAPSHFISTIGYNGTSPGPILRMREGKPVTVDVINDTDAAELVHWHGLFLPSAVDGAEEEGTPPIAAGRHGSAINSRRSRREPAGITPMPWRWAICIVAPTPGSMAF